MSEPVLFVEGIKLSPSATKVMVAIAEIEGSPHVYPDGVTIAQLHEATGYSKHVIRARLNDLRNKGFVVSDQYANGPLASSPCHRYAHTLTEIGWRRARQR